MVMQQLLVETYLESKESIWEDRKQVVQGFAEKVTGLQNNTVGENP